MIKWFPFHLTNTEPCCELYRHLVGVAGAQGAPVGDRLVSQGGGAWRARGWRGVVEARLVAMASMPVATMTVSAMPAEYSTMLKRTCWLPNLVYPISNDVTPKSRSSGIFGASPVYILAV
jgi:hypothetical protein